MLFRIVAPNTHRASLKEGVFTCLQVRTAAEPRPQITWTAYLGDAVLKDGCRTLNEAKQVCRAKAAETQGG